MSDNLNDREMIVQPGDIFMTTSASWFSRAVLWAQREEDEEPSVISHVGMFTQHASLDRAMGIEANWRVNHHRIWERYCHKDQCMIIMRPTHLGPKERSIIVGRALSFRGEQYGWWKLLFHLGHKLTGWDWFLDLAFIERYPICSFLVADAYQAIGENFGVPDDEAQPDDIFDYTIKSSNYACVLRLTQTDDYPKGCRKMDVSVGKNIRILGAASLTEIH